jgi:hypothetical protein
MARRANGLSMVDNLCESRSIGTVVQGPEEQGFVYAFVAYIVIGSLDLVSLS